jgi:hypothetical protein
VTGCNSYYLESWYGLYNSIKRNIKNPIIYFFDLGLTQEEKNNIVKLDLQYYYFDFSLYPNWVNIKNEAGQWAWKPQCIKQILEQYPVDISSRQYLIWCDSRNLVDNNLDELCKYLDKNGIYVATSSGDIEKWTFPKTIKSFKAEPIIHFPMRNASFPCFNINVNWVRKLINDYATLCLIKDIIFPEGSSRLNHRQDQSVLTLLYYKYHFEHKFDISHIYLGIRCHTNENFVRPFKH